MVSQARALPGHILRMHRDRQDWLFSCDKCDRILHPFKRPPKVRSTAQLRTPIPKNPCEYHGRGQEIGLDKHKVVLDLLKVTSMKPLKMTET